MTRTAAFVRFAALVCAGATVGACGSGHSAPKSTPPGPSGSSSAPAAAITPDVATAMASSTRALTAVTSYDYRHLDASHANAVRFLADPFRSQYESSWTASVRPQARKLRAVIKGTTTDVAVAGVDADQVVVLAFGQQTVSNTGLKTPRVDTFALRTTMTRAAGGWLLSGLDTIGPGTPPTRPSTTWASPDLAAALLSGTDCLAKLQTIDRRHLDAQVQAMLDCTTGDLQAQVRGRESQLRTAAASNTSVGAVASAGAASLAADRAGLLVATTTTSTPRSGSPTEALQRYLVTLRRVSGRWLVSDLVAPALK